MINRLIQVAQRQMARVVEDAQALPFATYEEADSAELYERLVPEVQRLLRQTGDAVRLVEHLAEHRDSFSHCNPQPTPETVNQLADLCFVVQGEVASRRAHLRKLAPEAAKWALLVAAERATVELIRGLAAVEKELCEITGEDRLTDQVDLVKEAIKARAAVKSFRRSASGEFEEPEEALEVLSVALAHLIGRDDFSHLRVSDRLSARNLHARIQALQSRPEASKEDRLRMIQDVQAFAVLLDRLNDREELIVHDAEVMEASLSALGGLDPQTPLPPSEFKRLAGVFGRDDELGSLIVSKSAVGPTLDRLSSLLYEMSAENEILSPVRRAV